MRVIAGIAGGRKLESLSGSDIVRPTSDRVKEGIFSSIQFMLEGRTFLDLFAGSGQMGIEALSRGASKAVFVDENKASIAVIKRNLSTVKLSEKAVVYNTDSVSYAKNCREHFDIAFLDPPYKANLLPKALPLVANLMNKGGKIICESPQNVEIPKNIGEFVLDRQYRYGKIIISTYVHCELKNI